MTVNVRPFAIESIPLIGFGARVRRSIFGSAGARLVLLPAIAIAGCVAWMMLSGVGNYFLILGGFVDPLSAKRAMGPLLVSVALQAALFVACVMLLWPRRDDRQLRATAIVLALAVAPASGTPAFGDFAGGILWLAMVALGCSAFAEG